MTKYDMVYKIYQFWWPFEIRMKYNRIQNLPSRVGMEFLDKYVNFFFIVILLLFFFILLLFFARHYIDSDLNRKLSIQEHKIFMFILRSILFLICFFSIEYAIMCIYYSNIDIHTTVLATHIEFIRFLM